MQRIVTETISVKNGNGYLNSDEIDQLKNGKLGGL